MPIGLFLCFTPVVIAWIKAGAGLKDPKPEPAKERRP